jgi:hypothetical protein
MGIDGRRFFIIFGPWRGAIGVVFGGHGAGWAEPIGMDEEGGPGLPNVVLMIMMTSKAGDRQASRPLIGPPHAPDPSP